MIRMFRSNYGRKHAPWISLLLAVFTLTTAERMGATQSAQSNAWQSDWLEFTKEYPRTEGDTTRTKQFVGKDVVWKGKIKKVALPDKGKDTGVVQLEMNPPLQLGKYSIDTLSLSPAHDDWAAWVQLQSGQAVVFRTRLTALQGDGGDAPVMFFHMFDGHDFAQMFTTGGKLDKVIPEPPRVP